MKLYFSNPISVARAFGLWAGHRWQQTPMQMMALRVEARKLGIPVVVDRRPSVAPRGVAHVPERVAITWRHETVTVKNKPQDRYRDLKAGRFIRKP